VLAALRQPGPNELVEDPRRAPDRDEPAELLQQDPGEPAALPQQDQDVPAALPRRDQDAREAPQRQADALEASPLRAGGAEQAGAVEVAPAAASGRASFRWDLAPAEPAPVGWQARLLARAMRAALPRRQQRQQQTELMIGSCGLSPLESLWSRSDAGLTIHNPGAGAQPHRETAEMMTARFHQSRIEMRRIATPARSPVPEVNWHLDGSSGDLGDSYASRSTIICLISAMAFAGLRPLGQAFEQFMMVWQR
jgi:hypothetical protein